MKVHIFKTHFKLLLALIISLTFFLFFNNCLYSQNKNKVSVKWPQNVTNLLGNKGAVLVLDSSENQDKQILYAHNASKNFIPASILKVLTSAVALEYLKPDYRFRTDFYINKNSDLTIKGYGDPFLVNEEIDYIVQQLKAKKISKINNIYLDNSFFTENLILDGNNATYKPYDAFNIALATNFNTVGFHYSKTKKVSENSDATPLTDLTLQIANDTKIPKNLKQNNWVNINQSPQLAQQHAGEIFKAFFIKNSVPVSGEILNNESSPLKNKLIYKHKSSKNLTDLIEALLKNSNNFVANQIFLTLGAEIYGAPATLEKSLNVVEDFFNKYSISKFTIYEGSGLSRSTFVSANDMAEILKAFLPYRFLMDNSISEEVYCKTGTMLNVQSLAGYIERAEKPDNPLIFIIILNGSFQAGDREKVLNMLKTEFKS